MAKRKNKSIIVISIVVATILALFVTEVLRGPRSVFSGFNREDQRGYEQIAKGLTKDQAIHLLSQPIEICDTFCLPQRQGFERLFDAAERSDAVEYLLWVNGTNWYYCIGFDSYGRVAVKGEGHS